MSCSNSARTCPATVTILTFLSPFRLQQLSSIIKNNNNSGQQPYLEYLKDGGHSDVMFLGIKEVPLGKILDNQDIIPNTAVFGPTNFIGTTTSTTIASRMTVYALDEKGRFLNLDF